MRAGCRPTSGWNKGKYLVIATCAGKTKAGWDENE